MLIFNTSELLRKLAMTHDTNCHFRLFDCKSSPFRNDGWTDVIGRHSIPRHCDHSRHRELIIFKTVLPSVTK